LYEKLHSCFTLDRRGIEKPTSLAEAMINLLKGDDVGANVSDYVDDAIRSDYSIRASTFVDVV
jgi:hypothetical protein